MATSYLVPLAPLISISVGFMFFEYLVRYPRIRYALCGVNIICVGLTMWHPPTPIPFFNYIIGLLSVVHVVRSLEILIILDPLSMRRLKKIGSSCYCWEPIPPQASFRRSVWIIDLLSNPRGVGWSHGTARYLPAASQIFEKKLVSHPLKATTMRNSDRRRFLWNQVRRLVVVYLWFYLYLAMFVHDHGQTVQGIVDDTTVKMLGIYLTPATSHNLYSWLARIAWIISVQFFFDACHAFLALTAVGVFTESWLGTAGEPWAYPALFGGFRLSKPNLKDFWANWWHNILLRPFLSVAVWLYPPAEYRTRYIWIIFTLSGVAHGAGSYTATQHALPAAQVFIGFCIQPVATIYQQKSAQWLHNNEVGTPVARSLIVWVIEVVGSVAWVICILPLQFDDPSQEAPFSFLRLPWRS